MRFYAGYFLLRLTKAKRILLPLRLSFLLTFSMNVLRSGRGFSATFGSFLFSFADTGSIIAYVRGLGQLPSHTRPPNMGKTSLKYPGKRFMNYEIRFKRSDKVGERSG